MRKQSKKIYSFVKEITWLAGRSTGWGNGYVCIPKGHKAYGMDYDAVSERFKIEIHGGLTFASKSEEIQAEMWKEMPLECKDGYYIYGFDCAHYGDNPTTRPKEFVLAETERLKKQFEKIK